MASLAQGPIVLVQVADAAYAQHVAVLWSSVAAAHAPGRVRCVVFSDAPEVPEMRRLHAFGLALGLDAQVRPLDMALVAEGPEKPHIPRITYARLLLPDLLEGTRAIYLDSDLVVRKDLTPLWQHDLRGAWVGAVPDGGVDMPWRELGLASADEYVNAGMLLLDLEAWRRHGVAEACRRFTAASAHTLRFQDQDVINAVTRGHVDRLDARWNWMEHQPGAAALRDPAIVHFAGRVKPWHDRSEHPWRHVYAEHLARTPWRGYRPPDRTLRRVLARALLPDRLRRAVREADRRVRRWRRGGA